VLGFDAKAVETCNPSCNYQSRVRPYARAILAATEAPDNGAPMHNPLDDVVHLIQTALTPAFLLAGLAALLSVFASRLDRVTRQVNQFSQRLSAVSEAEAAHICEQLGCLRLRTKLLDAAVVFGGLAGGLTCLAALVLFVGGLSDVKLAASFLLWTFGLALSLTIGAIAAFLAEMLLSSRGLRAEVFLRQAEASAEVRAVIARD
jgi:Protein of unknown function (DUF2721)